MSAKFPALDDNFPRIVPTFKQLVKIITECVDGGVSLNCTAFEFQQCDQALGTILGNFMEVLRLKELPAKQNKSIDDIILVFCNISNEMSKLETALNMDATATVSSCVNKIYKGLKDLEELNMELKSVVVDSCEYSEIPVVESILQAGHFVLDSGGFDWGILRARLDNLLPKWNEIITGEGLPEDFLRHDRALEQLVEVVNNQDLESLPEVLEEIKDSGEALVYFDDSQVESEDNNQSVMLCPYCGKAMTSGSSKCFACGARMPEAFERTLGLELQSNKSNIDVAQMPEYVQRIFEVGEKLPSDPKQFKAFKRNVGELRRRIASASAKVQKLASMRNKLNMEQRENVDSVLDLANDGLDKFYRALDILDGFELPVDRFHLQCALEVLGEAVEGMRGVGGLAQKYRDSKKK
ncbi:hypothetical protein IJT10_08835 [bacterium]|nr:hypothetical protein [bacterium]